MKLKNQNVSLLNVKEIFAAKQNAGKTGFIVTLD